MTADAISEMSEAPAEAVMPETCEFTSDAAAVMADLMSDRLEAFSCTSVGPAVIADRRSDISDALTEAVMPATAALVAPLAPDVDGGRVADIGAHIADMGPPGGDA